MTAPGSVHVFGVRHLSPGGAWHLRAMLDRVKPKYVLIEGLADAGPMVHHLAKKGTKPPVAILAYTDSVPVRTLVYPLAAYSPEFQALLWAKENGAKVEFIDLPSDVFLGLQDVEIERLTRAAETEKDGAADEPPQPDGTAGEKEAEAAWRPERERSIYERIAEREGEPDYDTYWERRFEHNMSDD
ncbi:MAG TPA: DUF5682 family protein, partial [Urbifossiella sp.]|nr:DUF5682 family protein [Urbifossiella sp.]